MLSATYSPDDNKLRIYSPSRLDADTYARVSAAGFRFAPKQELWVASAWSPDREDLLLDLCGEIGDEDTSLVERAEARAERFEGYGERRTAEAEAARSAVSALADHIPFGQPILVGHHSEARARRDAERIASGMHRAVSLWQTSDYWTERAASAVRHAKYKERPDVRARRIKGLEADRRKHVRTKEENERFLGLWQTPGLTAAQAKAVADRFHASFEFPLAKYPRQPPASQYEGRMGLWSALDGGIITPDQARALAIPMCERAIAWSERWIAHLDNRLAYERAMLAEQGGTAADRVPPEKGGACRCWASPRGGWSYIQRVNRVSVTVSDRYSSGRVFPRTIPFDKLASLMSASDVAAARAAGSIVETEDGIGFYLRAAEPAPPPADTEPAAGESDALARCA